MRAVEVSPAPFLSLVGLACQLDMVVLERLWVRRWRRTLRGPETQAAGRKSGLERTGAGAELTLATVLLVVTGYSRSLSSQ